MDHRPLEQNIETWPLSRIVEYARNPRNNEPAVDRMCASIREFGFKIPCLD
jgi:ParB-like chromosome segregation protein Spo0J